MSLKIYSGGGMLQHSTIRFSGGEIQVRLSDGPVSSRINIDARLHSSDDVMELLMVTDALRRAYGNPMIHLTIPYLPYARQDRVCASGEALSLRVFADLINSQQYASVQVWDAHSDTALAVLDRSRSVHQSEFVKRIQLPSHTVLVAPDAGALKKIAAVSQWVKLPFIRADKTRDPATGSITGTVIYSSHQRANTMLIVDDICDGGRTFIELAKELRSITEGLIKLYVTHGIFSRGLEPFEGIIDEIYCPNVFPNVPDHPILKRI